ncbi:MAG: OmpA family protein [Leptospiraceae bacterium]|nr:OmpA family protein [Leptospiraceae bacterium]MCP5493952.1 OmpA family protein [Leptospiraceae bacterium]
MRLKASLALLIILTLTFYCAEDKKTTKKPAKDTDTTVKAEERVLVDSAGNLIVVPPANATKTSYEVVVAPDKTLQVVKVEKKGNPCVSNNCVPPCLPRSMSLGSSYQNPVDAINALDDVYFAQGESNLTLESMQTLDKYLDILKRYPYINISITGWADYTGNDAINKAISLKRAESVKNYLVQNSISMDRIVFVGAGVYNSEHPYKDADGMRKSRVADIAAK